MDVTDWRKRERRGKVGGRQLCIFCLHLLVLLLLGETINMRGFVELFCVVLYMKNFIEETREIVVFDSVLHSPGLVPAEIPALCRPLVLLRMKPSAFFLQF